MGAVLESPPEKVGNWLSIIVPSVNKETRPLTFNSFVFYILFSSLIDGWK